MHGFAPQGEATPPQALSRTEPDYGRFLSDTKNQLQKIAADLLDQEIKLYPATRAGGHARSLWRQIKERLLRGAAVEITASALKLDWHREELRRAKAVLITMELIKPRGDGLYVLGSLGPFSRIDELIREEFFWLTQLEMVVVAIAAITKSTSSGGCS